MPSWGSVPMSPMATWQVVKMWNEGRRYSDVYSSGNKLQRYVSSKSALISEFSFSAET